MWENAKFLLLAGATEDAERQKLIEATLSLPPSEELGISNNYICKEHYSKIREETHY